MFILPVRYLYLIECRQLNCFLVTGETVGMQVGLHQLRLCWCHLFVIDVLVDRYDTISIIVHQSWNTIKAVAMRLNLALMAMRIPRMGRPAGSIAVPLPPSLFGRQNVEGPHCSITTGRTMPFYFDTLSLGRFKLCNFQSQLVVNLELMYVDSWSGGSQDWKSAFKLNTHCFRVFFGVHRSHS